MDPQSAVFTPRDDYWRMQTDMLRMQQVQSEQNDRLSRLERRQDGDDRARSAWGASSPFPSILSGTPQQGPVRNSPADPFPGFDDTSSNLLGSLPLDAEDEPRRIGTTSRANSVRFDESANQGHWTHTSRSSLEMIPRVGSGLGGHLLSERSFSHKSDGRQSSAGQSVHSATSGRANSLGLDTTFGLSQSGTSSDGAPGLAPGLFILGPVPAIMRCWLNTDFKHDALLYAAICTGSYTSHLDYQLIEKLGYGHKIVASDEGVRSITLSVFLPEAVQCPSSSRPNTRPPQLPSLTIDFLVTNFGDADTDTRAIRVFLGSDALRAHNADILLSQNKITLFDDDSCKLSIPLVRPEDEQMFKCIHTAAHPSSFGRSGQDINIQSRPGTQDSKEDGVYLNIDHKAMHLPANQDKPKPNNDVESHQRDDREQAPRVDITQAEPADGKPSAQKPNLAPLMTKTDHRDANGPRSAGMAPRSDGPSAIWSSWRKDTDKPKSGENNQPTPSSTQSYQRRDNGIKVLKATKPSSSRAVSSNLVTKNLTSSSTGTPQSRFFDDGKRRVSSPANVAGAGDKAQDLGIVEGKGPPGDASEVSAGAANGSGGKPRQWNPVGGASAFAWLNNSAK